MLSPLKADPLELWVLEWKRQLRIMTLERCHDESSVCVERFYSNKGIMRAMVTMHLKFVSVLNVCVYINISVDG